MNYDLRFTIWFKRLAVALLSLIVSPPLLIFAQGSLTPPGAPAPTMKTLDQMEPRVIVNATNTPGDSTTIFKITLPGSYYLATNIVGVSGKHGIAIEASQVTLDLNGFSLIGVPGSLSGIRNTNGATVGLLVRNGVIRNWGSDGISGLNGGYGATFSNLRVLNNGGNGMNVFRATVRDCVAQDNASDGILAYESSVVNCSATGNGTGFGVFFSSLIESCTAKFNNNGIDAGGGCSVINNTIQASSSAGLLLRDKCRVVGNHVTDGSDSGILLLASGADNVIEDNVIVGNTVAGINATNAGVIHNLIIRNSARGNGTNYVIGAGNSYGPIVNVGGVGDISGTTGANHPSANFSY
jgi:hypothetical protein